MIEFVTPRLTPERVAAVLRQVFRQIGGFAFRLWDGTEVRLGSAEPVCTVVVHSPDTFRRLMREPTPLNFAEAYVESVIDIEGDLFAAMKVANQVEELRLSMADRVRILASMWRA